jgi:hypothetical protein
MEERVAAGRERRCSGFVGQRANSVGRILYFEWKEGVAVVSPREVNPTPAEVEIVRKTS